MLNSFAGLASITPFNAIWLLSSLAFLQCRALRSLMHRHPSLSNFLVVLTPLASLANPAARRVRTTANSKTKNKSQQSKNIRRSSVWAKYGKSDLFDFIVCIVFIGEARVIRSKPLFARSLSFYPRSAPSTKKMVNDESKQAADDAAAAGDASRVRYSCSQDAGDTSDDATQLDLDFYFRYEMITTLGGATKVELPRLQIAYVFNLASKLLPCAGDTETTNESAPLEPSFVISALDSAIDDRLLNIGEDFWRLETR